MQHASSSHSQQERTQGLERKAIQALLKHPAFVEAVHGMLQPYARALPALAIPVLELTRRLGAAAAQLAFVQRCHTRLQFSDSRAVRAQTHSLAQVWFKDCMCLLTQGNPRTLRLVAAGSWPLCSTAICGCNSATATQSRPRHIAWHNCALEGLHVLGHTR